MEDLAKKWVSGSFCVKRSPERFRKGRNIGSHWPNHVRASGLLDQSAELRMKLTGHKTEGEHRKYTHHEMDNLRAAVGKIPFLG